ncbi:HIT family protein, partial [Candidatus Woesearchaeota archaeon]|nr:HIT family protein [Candidatus Woesearchaeota archaeon]
MSDCVFCGIVDGNKEARKLYEDEHVLAILADKPCALGHVQVILKKHTGLLKDVPNDIVSNLFWVASFAASAVFEYFGVQGTNIILHDALQGHEHPVLEVVPRKFDDGLDFQWVPKEYSEEENAVAFEKLKDKAFFIGKVKEEKKK